MSVLEVVHYGDPILRKKCNSVKDFSKLESLLNDMFDTMYEENGIGLAANQVGFDMNLFIIDIFKIKDGTSKYRQRIILKFNYSIFNIKAFFFRSNKNLNYSRF